MEIATSFVLGFLKNGVYRSKHERIEKLKINTKQGLLKHTHFLLKRGPYLQPDTGTSLPSCHPASFQHSLMSDHVHAAGLPLLKEEAFFPPCQLSPTDSLS